MEPGAKPACTRPRSRVPAARPDSASSAVSAFTPRHGPATAAHASAGRSTGVPASVGGVKRLAAQPGAASAMAAASTPLTAAFRERDLLFNLCGINVIAVSGQRLLPRGNRVGGPLQCKEHVAVVIEHDRAGGSARHGLRQMLLRRVVAPQAVVRPAQAVVKRGV